VSLDSKMMAAPVKLFSRWPVAGNRNPGGPVPGSHCRRPTPGINKQQYAVSSDGQRFLVNLAADEAVASPITLIYNWKPQAAK